MPARIAGVLLGERDQPVHILLADRRLDQRVHLGRLRMKAIRAALVVGMPPVAGGDDADPSLVGRKDAPKHVPKIHHRLAWQRP